MEKSEKENKLKALHKTGFKGVVDIVFKHRTFKKVPFISSILISVVFIAVLAFSNKYGFYDVLKASADLINTVFPGLLGFSLGGYAIAVGFSNNDLIKYATNTEKHNIYQILSGIFALSILFQALATIVSFIITWTIKVDFNSIVGIEIPNVLCEFINAILLLALFVSSLYSLLLTPYIVTNLFTLSQLNSLHFTLEKIKEENQKIKESESKAASGGSITTTR